MGTPLRHAALHAGHHEVQASFGLIQGEVDVDLQDLQLVHVLPQLRGNLNAQLSISRIRVHGADRGCIRVGKVIEVSLFGFTVTNC